MDASNIIFIVVLLVIVILVYALYRTNVDGNNFKESSQHWFTMFLGRGETINKLKKDNENLIKETTRLKGIITTINGNNELPNSNDK